MERATAEDVANRLRDAMAAYVRHDLEPYLAMLDPDYEIKDPTLPIKGKDAVRKLNEAMLEALPDMRFEVLSMAYGRNVFATEQTVSATFTGPLRLPQGTVPPTGRPVAFTYASFYRFNDQGLLTEISNYGLSLREAFLGLKS